MDIDYDPIGMLRLMFILQNTMEEEFIIVKHDTQHLRFISANIPNEDFKNLQNSIESLETLITNLQGNLKKTFKSYFNKKEEKFNIGKAILNFNSLRISYMKSLDIISNELDFLHKTTGEYLYSLPPIIDPVRRYKRKIDKDELAMLKHILESYKDRFENIINTPSGSNGNINMPTPLIFIDYSASTKLSDPNINKRINKIVGLNQNSPNEENKMPGFIKLPYWAIKITEYTSAIAHELVHLYLHQNRNEQNPIREIKDNLYSILAMEIPPTKLPYAQTLSSFAEELTVDTIALFIGGPAYYFTLFVQGTARYPKHYNITYKSTFMYARVAVLAKILRKMFHKSNLEIDREFINYIAQRSRSPLKNSTQLKSIFNQKKFNNSQKKFNKTLTNEKIYKELKKMDLENQICSENGILCPDLLEKIEKNNIFILNRMLCATENYMEYVLDEYKKILYSDVNPHFKERNFTILQKYIIERSITNKVFLYLYESLFTESNNNLELIITKLIKNKTNLQQAKKILKIPSKNTVRKTAYNALKKYRLKLISFSNLTSNSSNLSEVFYNFNNNSSNIKIQDKIISVEEASRDSIKNTTTNKSKDTKFPAYLIPEYLWENTLINFNSQHFDKIFLNKIQEDNKQCRSNNTDNTPTDKDSQSEKRLPKLQIARVLGIKDRYDLFFGNKGKNDLQITEIREWLFTKVDWKRTYSAIKNTKETAKDVDIVEEFSKSIPENNNKKLQIGFVLGDYDFIIDLKDASTRKDIKWPPSGYTDKGELLTYYSYREYIVERVEKRGDRTAQNKEANTKKREPYILQFIKFKKESKWSLYELVVGLLKQNYEVYLSNSWNVIFLKKNIKDLILPNKSRELTKDLFIPSNISLNKKYTINIQSCISDIQSYIVFPTTGKNSSETFGTKQIKVPNMKSIIKTSGYAENNSSYEKTLIKNIVEKVIKKVNIIGRNAGKDDVFLTLGIIDYMIDWGKVSLYDAKRIAINLINELATTDKFEHVSTLTSISVLDSINQNK